MASRQSRAGRGLEPRESLAMKSEEERARHVEHQRTYRLRHPERVAERERRYVATPEGRAARNAARVAWRRRNPERMAAHAAVTKALMRGHLFKEPCRECGNPKVDAHHHNGYDYEHRLDVVWLCRPHHQAVHR